MIGEIQRAAGATERLIELVETPVDIPQAVHPKSLPATVRGELKLKQVRFAYREAAEGQVESEHNDEVIRGLDLHIRPGERVALVGYRYCG